MTYKVRKRKPNLKYVISSEDEYDENCDSLQPSAKLDKSVQLKNGPCKTQRRDCVLQEIPTNSFASYTNNDASIIAPTINTRTKVTNSTLINKNENYTKQVAEKGKRHCLIYMLFAL
ncbi:uncharacterized protein LOC112588969 [Harpegnathos saltator]|uniref:uncharacterized protein LOC112588969 n=1 Tax=Harpegnathos saltator TaxID=610380 RepID=UPI000DBED6E8|nr:uncharacterized protein LOC112588969 [Harpegnathos saltator]